MKPDPTPSKSEVEVLGFKNGLLFNCVTESNQINCVVQQNYYTYLISYPEPALPHQINGLMLSIVLNPYFVRLDN